MLPRLCESPFALHPESHQSPLMAFIVLRHPHFWMPLSDCNACDHALVQSAERGFPALSSGKKTGCFFHKNDIIFIMSSPVSGLRGRQADPRDLVH
jgi:hypothetical protein